MKGESEGDFEGGGSWIGLWRVSYIVGMLTWDGLVKRWQKQIKKSLLKYASVVKCMDRFFVANEDVFISIFF